MTSRFGALLFTTAVGVAQAAPPDAAWRTVETERFRLHFPVDAEDWSLAAAARLEELRDRVEVEVGYRLERKVDIVVRDPYSTANGMAIPLLRRPRMELWVSPPPADSPIGWNRRWDEGLIIHEDAHIVHLARPSRGGIDAVLDQILGLGPISRKAPRWVAEGYATVVEGDQTGFGRPFSARLAAELRKLATEGLLPSYADLNGSPRWAGGGYAYGVGSAYLTWLRDRAGPDSLRHLWARMSAVEKRSFDEAFEGVFGDSPERLYGRFCAELTLAAMLAEQESPPSTTTRWLDLDGSTGSPAVSPNGERVTFVASRDRRVLEVWSTTTDEEKAHERRQREEERLLERDPLDIPDLRSPEPSIEQALARNRRDRAPSSPRWIDDERILFTGMTRDRTGRQRADLFVWDTSTGRERRLTRGGDVRDADPDPTGTWAVAVQQRWGRSQIVRVDLAHGAIEPMTTGSIHVVYDHPRISPDGAHLSWLQMHDGAWELWVQPIGGEARAVELPSGANLATPSWHPDGQRLILSMGTPSWLDLVEVGLDGGPPRRLTRSHGGAFSPDARGETLYWLDEDADGRDLHSMALPLVGEDIPEETLTYERKLGHTPAPPEIPLPAAAEVNAHRYGLGRSEGRGLLSGASTRGDHRLELGARYGDIIGRHELLVLVAGAYTPALGPTRWGDGARAALALRSLPVDLHIDAFVHRAIAGDGFVGGSVEATDRHLFPTGSVDGGIGGGGTVAIGGVAQQMGYAHARVEATEAGRGLVGVDLRARAAAGWFDGAPGAWLRSDLDVSFVRDALRLSGGYGRSLMEAPSLRLGGVRDATLPDAWQMDRILRPGLPKRTGQQHASATVKVGRREIAGLIERHLIGDALRITEGSTLVGFESSAGFDAFPLAKIPSGQVDFGVGCVVEDPENGFDRRRLIRLEHWTAWTAVTWRY
jgi:hypothetical protein